jgi:hypothetical protein
MKHYTGFGKELPNKLVDRQVALSRMIKRSDEAEKALIEKLKERYDREERTSKSERGQTN